MPDTTETPKPQAIQLICDEPYRIFFPLGLLCSLIGVSHWVWYFSGLTDGYSCNYHGLIQIQGFETAFSVGFLMTALPRFMEVPGSRRWELALSVGLFLWSSAALYVEAWAAAEVGYVALTLHLLVFGLCRYRSRNDDPPVEFLFVGFGLLHALAGGLLILWPISGFVKLGHRMVEQGVFLSFIMAIGPYLGPRLMGLGRPGDTDPVASRIRVLLYLLAGLALMSSFWIEAGLSEPGGRLVRAASVAAYLLGTVPIWRFPGRPLWHLRFLWLSFWCVIVGLLLSAVFPDYEVSALHVTFIGGFGLLTFTIATRVTVAHGGFEPLWGRNTKTLRALGICFLLALLLRLAADLYPDHYFNLLHIGAGFWLTGAVAWAVFFVPRMAPRHVSVDD